MGRQGAPRAEFGKRPKKRMILRVYLEWDSEKEEPQMLMYRIGGTIVSHGIELGRPGVVK